MLIFMVPLKSSTPSLLRINPYSDIIFNGLLRKIAEKTKLFIDKFGINQKN